VTTAAFKGSWLCPDEASRERLLDMEPRVRTRRRGAFAFLAVALLACGPWVGWWTLGALAAAGTGFAVADRCAARVSRPEYAIAAAWLLSEIMIAASVAGTGGPRSPAVGWFAIPIVTLSSRFDRRAVLVGVALAVTMLAAVTLGVDARAVRAQPQYILFPLAAIGAVAILSIALMESELEHRSESALDDLTGLLNRRALTGRVAEIAQQAQVAGHPVGVIVGDIDHFKAVNDAQGHATGDLVLVEVAHVLRQTLRAFDLSYRIGGEEFLVLLPGADSDEAAAVAERLRQAIEACPMPCGGVTMSFGVASTNGGPMEWDRLFGSADAALYDAKRAGRNRVVRADAEQTPVVPAAA